MAAGSLGYGGPVRGHSEEEGGWGHSLLGARGPLERLLRRVLNMKILVGQEQQFQPKRNGKQ